MGADSSARPAGERHPAALLPAPAARLIGFALFAGLGAVEWSRMVAGVSWARPVLWVAAAVLAATGVLAAQRLAARWRGPATLVAAVAALLAIYVATGLPLHLLKPRRWPELFDGLGSGAGALNTVRLPYDGIDPWPGSALQLLGAFLVVVAGLLAFWPRDRRTGYPYISLVALLTLVAVPVISLGGTQSTAFGVLLAVLVVAFLWLERVPLRPGIGVALLAAIAIAGGLPLATMADREQPWFDYKTFAESLGSGNEIRFNWEHSDYGPIDWPRDGSEVMRVKSAQPLYWKLRTLDEFSGDVWLTGQPRDAFADPQEDLAPNWRDRPRDTERIEVSVRRMRSAEVPGAGTMLSVGDATRAVQRSARPGEWVARGELQRGDSYTAVVHVPRPTAAELEDARSGTDSRRRDNLTARVGIDRGAAGIPQDALGATPPVADVEFLPFEWSRRPVALASFRELGISMDGGAVLDRSAYRRTWRLAQRLRARSRTAYEYVRRVDDHLQTGRFSYSETPPPPAPGQAPLEAFLFDGRSGYCQHYSGAMALLLRMGGIPARVATGFSAGGFSKRKQAWIVRDTDAHSWVEVWFDEYGWVSFDPTPAATPARSQIAALEPQDDPNAGDAAAAGADTTSPSRDRAAQAGRPGGGSSGAGAGAGGAGGGGPAWWLVALGLGGAALIGLAARGLRRARRRPLSPDRAIRELLVALRRAGRAAPPGETLTDLERRLGLSGDAAAYLHAVRAGRYAPMAAPPHPAHRRALRRALARSLGPAGRLRALWALPPRVR